MWGPGEMTMWHEFQYFTAQGYGVVYSNPVDRRDMGMHFGGETIKIGGSVPQRMFWR